MSSEDSPLERELRIQLALTEWDQRDLDAVSLAVHRIMCPDEPCRHRLDDVSEADRRLAQAAIDALRKE